MPRHCILNESVIERSPRVIQLEGIFDVPVVEKSVFSLDVDIDLDFDWNIGLVVGASGTGKTSLLNSLLNKYIVQNYAWSSAKSIVDDFPQDMSIRDITSLLSSVGFSSPPSWLRPFHVLSNGEQFRVHVARTLAEQHDLAVIDEFTSVVDRTVAQIGSCAVAKTVRNLDKQLVVASCHYDIVDWLQPDWILNTNTGEFQQRRLRRRPDIELTIERTDNSAWHMFSRHHYLDATLHPASKSFIAMIDRTPVAFCGVLHFPHPQKSAQAWRISRLVTLPDYQGVGIGVQSLNFVASIFSYAKRVTITTSHPAFIHSLNKSRQWQMLRKPSMSKVGFEQTVSNSWKQSTGRSTATFVYCGDLYHDKDIAHTMIS